MSNTLTYQGFTARVELDEESGVFWGKVLGLPDHLSISFEGETVAALRTDFHQAIDFYLAECQRTGAAPYKPASGKLMLRIPPEVHRAALTAAEAAGTSLNQWAANALLHATQSTV
ncbi:type II toxin-antitoxin system HicB family antitoxin [Melaminivora sp.]